MGKSYLILGRIPKSLKSELTHLWIGKMAYISPRVLAQGEAGILL
jgi:hypothetical protein